MLQFIAQINDKYSIAESVQMAIEGGCGWIQLRLPDMTDSEIRQMSDDIITMCREAGVFLTIEDRVEAARELHIHGVHLNRLDRPAAELREELGAEAVIGIGVGDAASVIALRNADIDYVSVDASMPLDQIKALISTVREAGVTIPVVVSGDIRPDDAQAFMEAGASGIATGRYLIESRDPVEAVGKMLAVLKPAN